MRRRPKKTADATTRAPPNATATDGPAPKLLDPLPLLESPPSPPPGVDEGGDPPTFVGAGVDSTSTAWNSVGDAVAGKDGKEGGKSEIGK